MSKFRIELSPAASKSFKKLEGQMRIRVQTALDILSENPLPPAAKKLTNSPYFRVRVGEYRILYQIENSRLIILVIEIAHKRKVYRKL